MSNMKEARTWIVHVQCGPNIVKMSALPSLISMLNAIPVLASYFVGVDKLILKL